MNTRGPRAVLHWSEVEQLRRRAAKIVAGYPSRWPHPGHQVLGDSRSTQLAALADDFGINVKTLYRYLKGSEPVAVHVGKWTAVFQERAEGAPAQVSSWWYDEETPRGE